MCYPSFNNIRNIVVIECTNINTEKYMWNSIHYIFSKKKYYSYGESGIKIKKNYIL